MPARYVILLGIILSAFPHPLAFADDSIRKISVGVLLPLSGPFERYGLRMQESFKKSVPPNIDLRFEDEACDPLVTNKSYMRLATESGVNIFLGPWCGSPQMVVAPQLKARKQFALLGASAPAEVFSLSGKRMFSTQFTIESESHFNAGVFNEKGFKKVAIVFQENAFSRAHEKAFRERFKGQVLETIAYTSEAVSELKSVALRIKRLAPDALYVPDAFPILRGFLGELRLAGLSSIPFYSVYSAEAPDVLETAGADGERLIYSYPDIGERDATDYYSEIAAKMLFEAIAKCRGDVSCLQDAFLKNPKFDSDGALKEKLILKTIRNGRFVPILG